MFTRRLRGGYAADRRSRATRRLARGGCARALRVRDGWVDRDRGVRGRTCRVARLDRGRVPLAAVAEAQGENWRATRVVSAGRFLGWPLAGGTGRRRCARERSSCSSSSHPSVPATAWGCRHGAWKRLTRLAGHSRVVCGWWMLFTCHTTHLARVADALTILHVRVCARHETDAVLRPSHIERPWYERTRVACVAAHAPTQFRSSV